ncbi:MAG: respiratory chain complex I subunit 1 family protein [Thermoplasmata archaeon]
MNVEFLFESWILNIVFVFILSIIGIFLGLIYKGFDRMITAKMQSRIGPPITQPFRDVRKLLTKENIVPENAVEWIFNGAPILALTGPLVALMYLPIGPFDPLMSGYGDLILVLYLLAVPALAMAAGGFSSGSPFATVGSQREVVLMMSYELPLAISAITVAWKMSSIVDEGTNPFSLEIISSNPVWGHVGLIGGLGFALIVFTLCAVLPGELSKEPFGQAEAKTEIADGVFVEYTGRNLGMFYIANTVQMIVLGSLVIALFFPYQISELLEGWIVLGGPEVPLVETGIWALLADIAFYLFKLLVIIYFGVSLIRVAFARLQIDTASYIYWVPVSIIGLVGLLLVVLGATV